MRPSANSDSAGLGAWGEGPRGVWFPNTVENPEQTPPDYCIPQGAGWRRAEGARVPEFDALLIVMTGSQGRLAADTAAEAGKDVVVWAWLCPERLIQSAEDHFPVVVGGPLSEEDVFAARRRGPGRTEETTLCADLEAMFGLDDAA